MRDGWRKKYALEYEVKSGEKANRLPARNLPLSTNVLHIRVILAREWIRKFLAEKSCSDTPESKDPESWLTPECSRMHIEPPSAAWSFSLSLSLSSFFIP